MICHLVKRPQSRNYHARIKLPGDLKVREVSLGCATLQVAQKRLLELYAKLEREASGILAPVEMREAARKMLKDHLESFCAPKDSRCSEHHVRQVRIR